MKETYLEITNNKLIEKKDGEAATCTFMPSSQYVQIEYQNSIFNGHKNSLRLDSRYRPEKTSTQ